MYVKLFRTSSANIFINLCPACCDTEKGGVGERDTGTATGKGVTRHKYSPRLPACYAHSHSIINVIVSMLRTFFLNIFLSKALWMSSEYLLFF